MMHIPYVIDNIEYRLADVLNYLLQREQGQQVDVATAYFSIRGFAQLRETLPRVQRFRLLLGDKPLEGEDIGLRPDSAAYLRHELNAEPFTASTLRLVEDLIRFLRRDDVDVQCYLGHDPNERSRRYFLHAKCYLLLQLPMGTLILLVQSKKLIFSYQPMCFQRDKTFRTVAISSITICTGIRPAWYSVPGVSTALVHLSPACTSTICSLNVR